MGTKRIGLARVEVLMENLKREMQMNQVGKAFLNARQRELEKMNKKYGDQEVIEKSIERDAMLLFHKNK